MNKPYKRFTKTIANDIANISLCYVLEDVLYSTDDGRYCLTTEADSFEDNFVEDIELKGFIVTEYRLNIVKQCFTKQLEKIKDKIESVYKKESNKYTNK